LAPNYAAVKWAYGNFLLRLGDADRGFRLVAEAAGSDQAYRTPALQTTLQVFEGNPLRARQALGATPEVDAALTEVLAAQQRFPEAAASWARIANNEKFAKFSYSGGRLIAEARAANEFRIAASVAADLTPDGTERPEVGKLVNGGFEGGIKLRDSGPFEWNIAEGAEPRIGLSEGVLRTGRFSLFFTFNSFETANSFRPVTQLVAVEPAAIYEFSGFYRADLKTKAEFRWEITQAASGQQIAVTEPLTFAGDWTTFRVQFSVPATVDGIVVRFIRLNCGTGACPVAGRLVFDDLSLTKVSK
jgi:hypothetical protein